MHVSKKDGTCAFSRHTSELGFFASHPSDTDVNVFCALLLYHVFIVLPVFRDMNVMCVARQSGQT